MVRSGISKKGGPAALQAGLSWSVAPRDARLHAVRPCGGALVVVPTGLEHHAPLRAVSPCGGALVVVRTGLDEHTPLARGLSLRMGLLWLHVARGCSRPLHTCMPSRGQIPRLRSDRVPLSAAGHGPNPAPSEPRRLTTRRDRGEDNGRPCVGACRAAVPAALPARPVVRAGRPGAAAGLGAPQQRGDHGGVGRLAPASDAPRGGGSVLAITRWGLAPLGGQGPPRGGHTKVLPRLPQPGHRRRGRVAAALRALDRLHHRQRRGRAELGRAGGGRGRLGPLRAGRVRPQVAGQPLRTAY